jgi:hypothetical protein
MERDIVILVTFLLSVSPGQSALYAVDRFLALMLNK